MYNFYCNFGIVVLLISFCNFGVVTLVVVVVDVAVYNKKQSEVQSTLCSSLITIALPAETTSMEGTKMLLFRFRSLLGWALNNYHLFAYISFLKLINEVLKKIIAFTFVFNREFTSSGEDIVTMINWQHRALRVDNRALIYIALHFCCK